MTDKNEKCLIPVFTKIYFYKYCLRLDYSSLETMRQLRVIICNSLMLHKSKLSRE